MFHCWNIGNVSLLTTIERERTSERGMVYRIQKWSVCVCLLRGVWATYMWKAVCLDNTHTHTLSPCRSLNKTALLEVFNDRSRVVPTHVSVISLCKTICQFFVPIRIRRTFPIVLTLVYSLRKLHLIMYFKVFLWRIIFITYKQSWTNRTVNSVVSVALWPTVVTILPMLLPTVIG